MEAPGCRKDSAFSQPLGCILVPVLYPPFFVAVAVVASGSTRDPTVSPLRRVSEAACVSLHPPFTYIVTTALRLAASYLSLTCSAASLRLFDQRAWLPIGHRSATLGLRCRFAVGFYDNRARNAPISLSNRSSPLAPCRRSTHSRDASLYCDEQLVDQCLLFNRRRNACDASCEASGPVRIRPSRLRLLRSSGSIRVLHAGACHVARSWLNPWTFSLSAYIQ